MKLRRGHLEGNGGHSWHGMKGGQGDGGAVRMHPVHNERSSFVQSAEGETSPVHTSDAFLSQGTGTWPQGGDQAFLLNCNVGQLWLTLQHDSSQTGWVADWKWCLGVPRGKPGGKPLQSSPLKLCVFSCSSVVACVSIIENPCSCPSVSQL